MKRNKGWRIGSEIFHSIEVDVSGAKCLVAVDETKVRNSGKAMTIRNKIKKGTWKQ